MTQTSDYDVVIVGARCAGSATAMLLARQGHRVLLVDRATFPSDTLSTHIVWQRGVEYLQRWGIADSIVASGCPPVRDVVFDTGAAVLRGQPRPSGDADHVLCVRRTVLDSLLVDAAGTAGAELSLGTAVTGMTSDDGRVTGVRIGDTDVRAQLVIGADGMHSRVAREVQAPTYHEVPAQTCLYYTYFSDIDVDHLQLTDRPGRGLGFGPTNDGLTLVVTLAPSSEAQSFRDDTEACFYATLDLEPAVASVVRSGRRVDRFHGTADLPNFFRQAAGDGWALVGDAGCHKDPITAQGISDAFRDADLLATAVDAGLRDPAAMASALRSYQEERDEDMLPMYEFTTDMASFEPPPEDQVALLQALVGQPDHISDFLGVFAGSVPIPAFFDDENIARIFDGATAVAN
jgi:2-polyprenyl-6-methoxyphenol hydroxylase-like FAD-dependent oxidoreductase